MQAVLCAATAGGSSDAAIGFEHKAIAKMANTAAMEDEPFLDSITVPRFDDNVHWKVERSSVVVELPQNKRFPGIAYVNA
jgi:hypothetical protein